MYFRLPYNPSLCFIQIMVLFGIDVLGSLVLILACNYTPYDGSISTSQKNRKLDISDPKLEGNHSITN